MVFLTLSLNPLYLLLRGTVRFESFYDIKRCGLSDFWLLAFILVVYSLVQYWAYSLTSHQEQIEAYEDKPADYNTILDSPYQTELSSMTIVMFMAMAGVASGYLSSCTWIAVMTSLYLLKAKASIGGQTGLLIIVWVAAVTTLAYLMKGMVEPTFGLVSGIVCFIAVIVARFTLYERLVRDNKTYIFLILLSILTLASIPATILELLPLYMAKKKANQLFTSYRPIC